MKLLNKKTLRTRISGGLVTLVLAIAFAAIAYIVAGLILSYSTKVNVDVASTMNSNASLGSTAAYSITNNVTSGLSTFGGNMPTIASVIVAVVIISLLFLGFGSLINRVSGGGNV